MNVTERAKRRLKQVAATKLGRSDTGPRLMLVARDIVG